MKDQLPRYICDENTHEPKCLNSNSLKLKIHVVYTCRYANVVGWSESIQVNKAFGIETIPLLQMYVTMCVV